MSEVTERIHCRECGSKDMNMVGIDASFPAGGAKPLVSVNFFCGKCFVKQTDQYIQGTGKLARAVHLEYGLEYKFAKEEREEKS